MLSAFTSPLSCPEPADPASQPCIADSVFRGPQGQPASWVSGFPFCSASSAYPIALISGGQSLLPKPLFFKNDFIYLEGESASA